MKIESVDSKLCHFCIVENRDEKKWKEMFICLVSVFLLSPDFKSCLIYQIGREINAFFIFFLFFFFPPPHTTYLSMERHENLFFGFSSRIKKIIWNEKIFLLWRHIPINVEIEWIFVQRKRKQPTRQITFTSHKFSI